MPDLICFWVKKHRILFKHAADASPIFPEKCSLLHTYLTSVMSFLFHFSNKNSYATQEKSMINSHNKSCQKTIFFIIILIFSKILISLLKKIMDKYKITLWNILQNYWFHVKIETYRNGVSHFLFIYTYPKKRKFILFYLRGQEESSIRYTALQIC